MLLKRMLIVKLLGGGSGDCWQCKEKERGLDVSYDGLKSPMMNECK